MDKSLDWLFLLFCYDQVLFYSWSETSRPDSACLGYGLPSGMLVHTTLAPLHFAIGKNS